MPHGGAGADPRWAGRPRGHRGTRRGRQDRLVRRFLDLTGLPWALQASGEQLEQSLSLGVVDQLARCAQTAPARALIAVVDSDEGRLDPLTAGAALLDMLGALQHHSTDVVVVVIDDAQWVDRPSLHALAFALRRLRIDQVLTLVLVRDVTDAHLPDGFQRLLTSDQTTRLALSGLEADELRALSSDLGPRLSLSAAKRLRRHTDGNPLYARAATAARSTYARICRTSRRNAAPALVNCT